MKIKKENENQQIDKIDTTKRKEINRNFFFKTLKIKN